MELTGKYFIPSSREKVWEALNDPEILRDCIPGCQKLSKTSSTSFDVIVAVKVGPVKAKFSGSVEFSEIDAPNSYRISGQGKGGAAGFAQGGAKVILSDVEGGTELNYAADAIVSGKLAQIGTRLIDSTAQKMAGQFFSKFVEKVKEGISDQLKDGEDPTFFTFAQTQKSTSCIEEKTENSKPRFRLDRKYLIAAAIALVVAYTIFAN